MPGDTSSERMREIGLIGLQKQKENYKKFIEDKRKAAIISNQVQKQNPKKYIEDRIKGGTNLNKQWKKRDPKGYYKQHKDIARSGGLASQKLQKEKMGEEKYYKHFLKKSKMNNSGYFYSNKNKKDIYYQSSLELKHLQQMEKDSNIIKFDNGPRILYYDYLIYNKERVYLVDWKIWYKDETIKLVETKPFEFVTIGIDGYQQTLSLIPKLEAVEEYCESNNMEFEFWC